MIMSYPIDGKPVIRGIGETSYGIYCYARKKGNGNAIDYSITEEFEGKKVTKSFAIVH